MRKWGVSAITKKEGVVSQSFSTTILPKRPKGPGNLPTGKQALGYTRVSDHPQAEEDKASLPEQEHSIRKYCAEKGYILLEILSDVGRRWEAKKPGFQRLIKVAKEKLQPGDVIVVWKIDRLIGSASTAAAVEPLVDQCGINIEATMETFDKRWLLFYAAIGKGETEAKRDRGKLGIRTAVSRRHYVGTPPYGRRLNKEKKVVELDPEEASWYRRMLIDWKDLGDEKVAQLLNNQGVPTRNQGKVIKVGPRQGQIIGKGWIRSYVRKLRNDPGAYGYGSFKIKGGDVIEFPLPAVVSKADWDKEKEARAKRSHFGHRRTNRVYPVPYSKFKCGGCGLHFRLISRSFFIKRKRANGEIRTYRRKTMSPTIICRGMDLYPHLYQCRKSPKYIMYEPLQAKVLDNLLQILTPEFCQKLVSEPLDTSGLEQRVERARASRDEAKREVGWLVTQGRKGIIPEDVFELQLKTVKEEMEAKEEYLAKAESELEKARNDSRRAGEIAYAATVLRENMKLQNQILRYLNLMCPDGSPVIDAWQPKLDEAARAVREVVDDLIESIVVMPDGKLIINYNFPVIEEVRSRQLTMAS